MNLNIKIVNLQRNLARPLLRRFASNTSSYSSEDENKVRELLLKSSFIHAKTLGFTDAAIEAACRDLNYPSVSILSFTSLGHEWYN